MSVYPSAKTNKAGYTATPVACGLAGVLFNIREHLGRSSKVRNLINAEKINCDRTDWQGGV